ncbi:MAG: translocation/assembly module TamB [Chlorobium sp.]|nr:MAG: translocation/assembly module TamB [Chlorobium sp.]
MKRIKHYSVIILIAFSGFVLFLSLVSLLVLNSGILDLWAKNRVVSLFNEQFFSRLDIEELHLKFPNNVVLINPRIYDLKENKPALEARRVSMKFNFLTVLQPKIKNLYLRSLDADSLSIDIVEGDNGKLNLQRIFKPRGPDSTRFPIEHFFCKKLKLDRSSLSFTGNKKHAANIDLALKDVSMSLSSFSAMKNELKGSLDQLLFNIPRHRFSLLQASGKFQFSENRSEVLVFKAESNKSRAELSATIDHFNIFSSSPLTKEINLSTSFLNIRQLDLHSDDIRMFYPAFDLPPGIYSLKGNAKGKADNIDILDARLTHLDSKLVLKGKVINLQNNKALAYQLECDSSRIAEPFLESFLKDNSHKELARRTGNITFIGQAKGSLHAVQSKMNFLSGLGEASLDASIAAEETRRLSAKGTFVLKKFQLHKVIADGKGKSLLNAEGSFEGKKSANSEYLLKLETKISNSFWLDQPVQDGSLSVSYENRMLDTSVSLTDKLSSFTLTGGIDWKDKSPRYHAAGKAVNVDISKATGQGKFRTDLNGNYTLQGNGFDPGMINIAASMQFSPSTINGYQLKDRSKITAQIEQTPQSSKAGITSDFLDIQAEGDYSFRELLDLGKFVASGVSKEIYTQNIWHSTSLIPWSPADTPAKPFTVKYRVSVKDISPLALILPVQGFSIQGNAEGHAVYRNGQCTIGSSLNIARFQAEKNFLLENVSGDISLECGRNGVSKAAAYGKAASAAISEKKIGAPVFSGNYTPSHLDASLELAVPKPAQNFSAKFATTRNGNQYDLVFNQLAIKDAAGSWQAAPGSHMTLARASAKFYRFTVAKGGQQAVFDGELSNTQAGTFQCMISNIDVNELKRFYLDPALDKLSGIINASLTVSGSPGSKTSSLKISGQKLRYDKVVIGSLQANATHNGSLLRFDMHSRPAANETSIPMNVIDGSGTIPLVLNYYPLTVKIPEQQTINASFRSDNLSAQFLEYILPLFESAEGIIPTTLRIEGRTPRPDIYLTSTLRNTGITIAPTQVSYRLNGEVLITPQAMELRNINVSDNQNGSGKISGMVKLVKMEPQELSLGGKFNKLLLFDKKDKKDETSFGTVTGSTDNILFHGTLSAPIIEGELMVDSANFSLYRFGANESAKYAGVDKFIEFIPRYPSPSAPVIEKKESPADFYFSIIDILQIKNLRLSNAEPLKCSIIFDRIRGEQIETSLNNLSLLVNKNSQQYRLFGSVNITGGKYKFSNSSFDLQDGGKITWNNADIRNGVMDNLFGSKLVNAASIQTGERDNVRLLIAINGTLNEPKVVMGYYLNEQSQPYASVNMIGGQPSQIDPNAELNFITMMFSKQWYIRPGGTSQYANAAVSNVGISAGTGLLSSRISKAIEDIAGLESFNVNMGVDKRGEVSGLDLYFALKVPGTSGKMRFIGTGTSIGSRQTVTNDSYGMSQKIEYRVTPKIYIEASRSYGQINNSISNSSLQKPAETWGLSVSYKERFQTWDQFWKRLIPSSDKNK